MRSRFYQPGEPRSDIRPADAAVAASAKERATLPALSPPRGANGLMIHCVQEMNHLSTFLPALYAEFGRRR